MFADDIALYHSVQQEQYCLPLQHHCNTVALWCKLWQMKLNPSKCEALCISNKCPPPSFQCSYGDNVAKWTDAVHYLRVTFNTHLNWNQQCKYAALKTIRSSSL